MYPVLFSLGERPVHSYTVAVGVFLLASLLWLAWSDRRHRDGRLDAGLAALVAGLVGARIVHVIANWSYYQPQPLEILALADGGLSLHAGLLAGMAGLVVFVLLRTPRPSPAQPLEPDHGPAGYVHAGSRTEPGLSSLSSGKESLLSGKERSPSRNEKLALFAGALAVPVALALVGGWLGCLLAGCAYGRDLPPPQRFYTPDWPDLYGVYAYRLPTQALGLALAVILLIVALQWPGRPGLLLILLGVGDFLIAWTRGDLPPPWGPLLAPQWADLILILAGVALELRRRAMPAPS